MQRTVNYSSLNHFAVSLRHVEYNL